MKNLQIEHLVDEGRFADNDHDAVEYVGVDVWAMIDGKRTLIASLSVKYRNGHPRVVLCTKRADTRLEDV